MLFFLPVIAGNAQRANHKLQNFKLVTHFLFFSPVLRLFFFYRLEQFELPYIVRPVTFTAGKVFFL